MQIVWSIGYWLVFMLMVLATALNVWTWRKCWKQKKKLSKLIAEYDVKFSRDKFFDRYFVVQLGNGYVKESNTVSWLNQSACGWDVTKAIMSAQKFTSLKEARKTAKESGGSVLEYIALGSPDFKEAEHA